MPAPRSEHPVCSRQRQRGGILIFTALGMGVLLACLLVLDIANLVWQKREIQKIADLAAVTGANSTVEIACLTTAKSVALANGLADSDVFDPQPGFWGESTNDSKLQFIPNSPNVNACHVTVTRDVKTLFPWALATSRKKTVSAQATAVRNVRAARLSIRTQLAKLNTQDSLLLNGLVGGLLGGELSVGLMGWQGLLDTNIELLRYLKALAIHLDLDVGNYEELLNTELAVGDLIAALLTVVEQNSNTASLTIDALRLIQEKAQVSDIALRLGDIISVQTGLPQEALRTDLNVLQLVQALVQVGNGQNAIAGGVKIPLAGLANIDLYLSVIEPPVLSAIGDPDRAIQDPLGADQIFVRSAQTRALISVDLPLTGFLTEIVNGLVLVLSPVINFITGGGGDYMVLKVLPAPLRIDVGVDIGSGRAYLTDFSCRSGEEWVDMSASTALAKLRVGNWGINSAAARENAFSNHSNTLIGPIAVVRMDCVQCHGQSEIRQYFGGLGLKLELPLLESSVDNIRIQSVPSLDEPIKWGAASSTQGVIASLGSTVKGLDALQNLPADSRASEGGLPRILRIVNRLLGSIISLIEDLIVDVLAPLIDPIVDSLLKLLGVNIAGAEYGAQLNCGDGAELVY